MKTKAKKSFMNMDERNKLIAYRIMAIMYIITIVALQVSMIYRQFVMGQNHRDFEDLNIITTVNSLFLISALLYYGAIPIQKLRIKSILLIYFLFVVLGSAFTTVKYKLVQSPGLSIRELFDKLLIVYAVTGLIILFFILFSLLGKRRMEKELE